MRPASAISQNDLDDTIIAPGTHKYCAFMVNSDSNRRIARDPVIWARNAQVSG